ncbi:sensor histidine kinase [Leptolyngbya sp. NIES-2104]|uniref:sensor histidine kinase n=1 Tax=Leptolyngbya sp. NIES-2104 TaxID=1552121 RepID=UPI0006EC51DC|nr:sensor histidine kinase [Leptolyngbya sp. NIES-2104]GAP95812.1 multi-sensor signal transduction histidine kinase [Leptolyngbya sp. NIES-2104]
MISSTNNGGFAQQVEAIRQRLASIRDRLLAQSSVSSPIQTEIQQELQSAIDVLQTARSMIQQAESSSTIEQLRASVREKETLLREIHHRIKNNLQIVTSLLDLQVMRTQDTDVQALLRSNQSRISSIALVHDRLSQSSSTHSIRLGEYVQSLVPMLIQTYAIEPNQITLRTAISGEIELASNRVVPVGLILNELISNALRHGLANRGGEVSILLRVENSQITLTVSDTGDRFPANFDLNAPQTLGFQIINSLVQQLNASLGVDRTPRTAITIRFDAADPE